MPALDAVKAFWILGIFLCMFFWLPTRLFSGRPNFSAVICMAGNWARMVLCVTIFVFLLSGLKVFGAITVVLLFLGAIIVSWFRKRTGMSRRLLTNLQATTINLIRHFESRSFGRFLVPGKSSSRSARPSWASRVEPWLKMLEGRELLGASLVVVLATSAVLRTEHAVRELRFDQPEQYSALLRTRQLMLNIHPAERPVVFPAMIATTSFLSSTDPMQVTRFLTPAIGLLLVLATGLLVQVSTRAGVASVAAMYCLGAAGFPPAINQTGAAVSTTGKMETIFSASPATIRPSPELAAGVLLLRPMAGLFALVMLCYGLVAWASLSAGIHIPDEMRTILPVAAAILVGCALAFIKAPLVARTGRTTATVLLAACLGVAVIWLRPQRFVGRCLEYEAAARATQEIAYSF